MKSWLRRLRGVLAFGTLWSVAGAVFSTIFALVAYVFGRVPPGSPLLEFLLPFCLFGAGMGFVLGSGFAGVLTVIERRRTLEELSPARAAVWAAMVGAGLPTVYYLVFFGPEAVIYSLTSAPLATLVGAATFGGLGGALAAGTVSLAKRAPPELVPGPLPDDGELLGVPTDG